MVGWTAHTSHAAVGVALASALGCGGETKPAPPPSPNPEAREEVEQERVDALRALGYTGFTEELVEEDEEIVPLRLPGLSSAGYTLVSSGDLAAAHLVDAQGAVIRAWRGTENETWSNVELLADGGILVPASRGPERTLLHMSWSGDIVWRAEVRSHHDVELTPEGTIATLTNGKRLIPSISPDVKVKDNYIVTLSRQGKLLEEASIHDLLATSPDRFTFQHVERMEENVGGVIDLLHCNSLEFMHRPELAQRDPIYAAGNILLSIRHQDTVAIFDWGEKRLVWAWGQGVLSGQHDATVLENGNILIFDNGLERSWSRIVELDPLALEIVWEYRTPVADDFFSLRKGSSQRLPNGNTLVANSDSGEAFEVTPAGETVWQYRNPYTDDEGHRATIVRVKRYPLEIIDRLMR